MLSDHIFAGEVMAIDHRLSYLPIYYTPQAGKRKTKKEPPILW